MILVVVRAFPGHARGERITDMAEVARVLAGPHAQCVLRVTVAALAVKQNPPPDRPTTAA